MKGTSKSSLDDPQTISSSLSSLAHLVKTAMNLLGFNVGDLRLPLAEMEDKNLEILKQELGNLGLKVQEASC